jgi:hypothetical protein
MFGALIKRTFMKRVNKIVIPYRLIEDQSNLDDLLEQIATLAHSANEYKSARQ